MPYKDPELQKAAQRLAQKKRYDRDPSVLERRKQWNRDNPDKAKAHGRSAYESLMKRRKADPQFDMEYRAKRRAQDQRRRAKSNAQKRERYKTDAEYRKQVMERLKKWREENQRKDGVALPTWLRGQAPVVTGRAIVHVAKSK